jgi:F-type H+-transporting ATPase subunit delta
MTRKYARPVAATAKTNPRLLAGLRVRVGSDVYESTVAGQLATLSHAV